MSSEQNNTPDWIKTHNREKAEEKRQSNEIGQRQLEASLVIKDTGPEFWKQLVDRVGVNVGALPSLEGEELAGSVSVTGTAGAELSCHIQVDRRSVRLGPELSRMNLFYRPGESRIRRWYQNREMGDIELVKYRNEVRAVIEGANPMTAQELGDRTVEWMAERVKARRSR
jgi:hypothetical protein